MQGVYTLLAMDAMGMTYKTDIAAMNANMVNELNSTLYSFREASAAGALTQLSDSEWIRLKTIFDDAAKSVTAITDLAKALTVRPTVYLGNLKQALATVQQYTVLTLGQNNVFNGSLTCNSNVTADIVAKLPALCKAPKLVQR